MAFTFFNLNNFGELQQSSMDPLEPTIALMLWLYITLE